MESAYQHMNKSWKENLKDKMIKWRREPVFQRIERPTRLDRARAVGYKAKQGIVLVRTRIRKGMRHRPRTDKGRDPGKIGRMKYTSKKSMQALAEMRVGKKYINMEVLNSYYIGEDGVQKFYEVILIDPRHPVIKADPKLNWICNDRRRVFRGLTSAAKKARI